MSAHRLVDGQRSRRDLVERGAPMRQAISGHLPMTIPAGPGQPRGRQPGRGVAGAPSLPVTRAAVSLPLFASTSKLCRVAKLL